MIYEFEDSKGNVVGIEYPIGKAPKIGQKIRRKGKVLRRVPSVPRAQIVDYQMTDFSLPRRELEQRSASGKVVRPGVDPKTGKDNHPLTSRYKRVDKMGRPVFRSVHEIRDAYSHEHVKRRDIVYAR